VIVVLLAIALAVLSPHFYILARVDPQEVGVRFRSGRIHEIVDPGVYGAGIVPTVDTTPEAALEESP
jgi:regulator of protease activity HflC (stomatin/prohibitin superfamily)